MLPGVYRESFRKSTWLYVGDNSDISQLDSSNSTSKESGYVSLSDLNLKTCDNGEYQELDSLLYQLQDY